MVLMRCASGRHRPAPARNFPDADNRSAAQNGDFFPPSRLYLELGMRGHGKHILYIYI